MRTRLMLTSGLAALAAVACSGGKPSADRAASERVNTAQLAAFSPLPEVIRSDANPVTAAKVDLGRRLYYETLLSNSHDVSCNSCHALNAYGADGRKFSMGDRGQFGGRNAPTVYNAAGHLAQFWDGRAGTVEEQALGPILNPAEMAMPDSLEVLRHLRADTGYVAAFRAAFPDEAQPVTYANVGRAIGAFERGLVTPSRWDRFLEGDSSALTPLEKQGFNDFVQAGCAGCHNGMFVGGASFQKVGLAQAWPEQADSGRFAVTKKLQDIMVFKVPSLRNVERTAPYFHDGSVGDLGEAVQRMARYQLGRELNPAEEKAITAWLESLTGEIPADYIAYPRLPE
ncbi:MAG: cytochrome-c peroxidase [Gemmatimonadales bacterium]